MKADDTLSDALFLSLHPGWTWEALQSAPADIVATMRVHDLEQAHESRRRK